MRVLTFVCLQSRQNIVKLIKVSLALYTLVCIHMWRASLLVSSSLVGSYVIYGRYKDYKRARAKLASHYELAAYRALPLRNMSRLWGRVNSLQLPRPLRKPILGMYVRAFNCNLDEAEDSSLANYASLGDFFRRALKADARAVDEPRDDESLCSPCDGLVLSTKNLSESPADRRLDNVKGVSFSIPS